MGIEDQLIMSAFADELEKISAITRAQQYREKKKAALKQRQTSPKDREALMQSFLESLRALLGAAVGGAAGAGTTGGLTEASRRRAGEAAEDPQQVKAMLRKVRKSGRLKKEYALTARGRAALKGQKPSKGRFRFTSEPK